MPNAKNINPNPRQYPINTPEIRPMFIYTRAPLSTDYRNFQIRDFWLHRDPSGTPDYGLYVLVDKPASSGVWIKLGGEELGDVQTLTGDSGGAIPPDSNGNIGLIGSQGITVDGSVNTLTINSTSHGLDWSLDTTTPISVGSGEAHVANGGAQIVYNLPATCSLGDEFTFFDFGGNGFQVVANGGQTILVGNVVTSGGGTVTSTAQGDQLTIICVVADTNYSSYPTQGNLIMV